MELVQATRSIKDEGFVLSCDPDPEQITEHRGPDEAVEARLKLGVNGIELVEYVKRTYKCDREEAFRIINRIAQDSAENIRKTFSGNQVLLMAFNLFQKAVESEKIRDAASILQLITDLITPTRSADGVHGVNVHISEFISAPK